MCQGFRLEGLGVYGYRRQVSGAGLGALVYFMGHIETRSKAESETYGSGVYTQDSLKSTVHTGCSQVIGNVKTLHLKPRPHNPIPSRTGYIEVIYHDGAAPVLNCLVSWCCW